MMTKHINPVDLVEDLADSLRDFGADQEERRSTMHRRAAEALDAADRLAKARKLHLAWYGTEWRDERCGCAYHPDDLNRTHGGGPHVHPCPDHGPDHR